MIRVSLVLLLILGNSVAVREFGFQKEHDGSLFKPDGPIQKITYAGKLFSNPIPVIMKIQKGNKHHITFRYIETCYDGVLNQDERGIDCGGPCSPGGKIFELLQIKSS